MGNRRIVNKLYEEYKSDGGQGWHWQRVCPRVEVFETGASPSTLALFSAIVQGIGRDTFLSKENVPTRLVDKIARLRDVQLALGIKKPNKRWKGFTAEIQFWLFQAEKGVTLFLCLEHPQVADLVTTTQSRVAALDIGSRFAATRSLRPFGLL